uniref:Lipase_3 domain-containing protein n=1 Tax=Rhabditophanes sp. KR3021 TaxID=114890 RepID=A0AC35TIA8_9BILA
MRARFEGYSKSKNIKAITFGQPRVGSYIWSQHFDKLIPQAFRVIHDQDIVPHIPSCKKDINSPLNNQTTNGNQICDGSGNDSFYHHGTEIWYPSGMEYGDIFYECLGLPKNEDFNCSDSLQYPMSQFNTFMDMHRYYFGMRVVSWGYLGCPEDVNATQPTGASLI